MIPPLHLSSCLFATIVAHAYYRRVESYHHMFLALTVTSILFHTTHGRVIQRIDKILAHLCFIMVVMDTKKAVEANLQGLLLFPFCVVCLWFGQSLLASRREWLHLGLHLTSVTGMHAYLWTLYKN